VIVVGCVVAVVVGIVVGFVVVGVADTPTLVGVVVGVVAVVGVVVGVVTVVGVVVGVVTVVGVVVGVVVDVGVVAGCVVVGFSIVVVVLEVGGLTAPTGEVEEPETGALAGGPVSEVARAPAGSSTATRAITATTTAKIVRGGLRTFGRQSEPVR
jgi:hypothetical protein